MPFDPSRQGRLGALKKAALVDGLTATAKAREVYDASFLFGHQCRICEPISIPADLPLAERQRRAVALKRYHFAKLAYASAQARAKRTASFANETVQEEGDALASTTTAS